MKRIVSVVLFLVIGIATSGAQAKRHAFALGEKEFLLDGKPLLMISGEMHPARIPREYWRHRIQMAKAMGCNTIAAYIFWNYHESAPGKFDFKTGNHDIAEFLRIAQQEGMWVLFRPGPYVCAEWELGESLRICSASPTSSCAAWTRAIWPPSSGTLRKWPTSSGR